MNEPNNAPYRTLKTIGLVLKANDNRVSESFWLRHRGDGNTFLLLTTVGVYKEQL